MHFPEGKEQVWLEALDSKHYCQTRKTLARSNYNIGPPVAFCCQGLAGHLLGIPMGILLRFGVLSAIPGVMGPFTRNEEDVLSHLNDVLCLTFPQIAAFVRGAPEELWEKVLHC